MYYIKTVPVNATRKIMDSNGSNDVILLVEKNSNKMEKLAYKKSNERGNIIVKLSGMQNHNYEYFFRRNLFTKGLIKAERKMEK